MPLRSERRRRPTPVHTAWPRARREARSRFWQRHDEGNDEQQRQCVPREEGELLRSRRDQGNDQSNRQRAGESGSERSRKHDLDEQHRDAGHGDRYAGDESADRCRQDADNAGGEPEPEAGGAAADSVFRTAEHGGDHRGDKDGDAGCGENGGGAFAVFERGPEDPYRQQPGRCDERRCDPFRFAPVAIGGDACKRGEEAEKPRLARHGRREKREAGIERDHSCVGRHDREPDEAGAPEREGDDQRDEEWGDAALERRVVEEFTHRATRAGGRPSGRGAGWMPWDSRGQTDSLA